MTLNLGSLLARLVVNSRSGLSPTRRDAATASCVNAQFRLQLRHGAGEMTSSIVADLIRDDARLNTKVFKQLGIQMEMEEQRNRELDLTGSQVSDLEPLSRLTMLTGLDLESTQVSDIRPIAELTALKSLALIHTQVSDIGPLGRLTALEFLFLMNTQVSNIGPLANLTALKHLKLASTQVSDIGPLAKLPALEWLDLADTRVSDIVPLTKLITLKRLDLTFTPVSGHSSARDTNRAWTPRLGGHTDIGHRATHEADRA